MPATPVSLNPIRAEELVLPLATFTHADFTIFVPLPLVTAGGVTAVAEPQVHVFFAAGNVQGDVGNDLLVHGLRSASQHTGWITIAVRGVAGGSRAVADAEIRACLQSLGIGAAPASLRLTGHSRGCDSLVASLQPGKITTMSIIDRVVFLDEAVEHFGAGTPTPGAVRLNRVSVVIQRGIPAAKFVSYEVGNRSWDAFHGVSARVPGAKYFELPPNGMAAIGCVRLIGDGVVRNPVLGASLALNPTIVSRLGSLLLPARGSFAVQGSGQSLAQFCQDRAAAIAQIAAEAGTPSTSLLHIVNANDLTRYGGFQFSWGIAAHHFFVAEIAHELTS